METRGSFGKALRLARARKSLSQEDFSIVSSRTYVSMLEREKTSPTLEKLEALCQLLDIHPATLVALSYLMGSKQPKAAADKLSKQISEELKELESLRKLLNKNGIYL